MRRVVITGMGAVTPLALDAPGTWEALKEGRSGIDLIDRFDTADFKVKVAAEKRVPVFIGKTVENSGVKSIFRGADNIRLFVHHEVDVFLYGKSFAIDRDNICIDINMKIGFGTNGAVNAHCPGME